MIEKFAASRVSRSDGARHTISMHWTLLDFLVKGKPEGRSIKHGDVMALAFVGAGMHINARSYK